MRERGGKQVFHSDLHGNGITEQEMSVRRTVQIFFEFSATVILTFGVGHK